LDLTVKVSECLFQHLAMPGIRGRSQVMLDLLADHHQLFMATPRGKLFGRELPGLIVVIRGRFFLLRFDRLTLPASCHVPSIGRKAARFDTPESRLLPSSVRPALAGEVVRPT